MKAHDSALTWQTEAYFGYMLYEFFYSQKRLIGSLVFVSTIIVKFVKVKN